jgi:hypothetical protein
MNPAMCLSGSALTVKNIVRRALERNYAEIRLLSKGGVQPNLNLEKVRGIVVPLCSSVTCPPKDDPRKK